MHNTGHGGDDTIPELTIAVQRLGDHLLSSAQAVVDEPQRSGDLGVGVSTSALAEQLAAIRRRFKDQPECELIKRLKYHTWNVDERPEGYVVSTEWTSQGLSYFLAQCEQLKPILTAYHAKAAGEEPTTIDEQRPAGTDPRVDEYARRLRQFGCTLFERDGEYVILSGDTEVAAHIYPGADALDKLRGEVEYWEKNHDKPDPETVNMEQPDDAATVHAAKDLADRLGLEVIDSRHQPSIEAVRVLHNYDDTEHTFDTPAEALEWLREHGLGLVTTQGLTSVSAIDQVCKLMTASEDASVDVNLRSLAQIDPCADRADRKRALEMRRRRGPAAPKRALKPSTRCGNLGARRVRALSFQDCA